MPIIVKESNVLTKEEKNISFENLLKIAINNLDKIVEIQSYNVVVYIQRK